MTKGGKMPKQKLSDDQVLISRVLAEDGWTRERIAEIFEVDQSTITYALKNRKLVMRGKIAEALAVIAARVITRVSRAASLAVAKELRIISQQLEENA
jgi:hypothetical protein